MSELINLQKKALVSLQKAVDATPDNFDSSDISLQCTMPTDFSGSMRGFLMSQGEDQRKRFGGTKRGSDVLDGGAVAVTAERLLALITTGLDPDGIVPLIPFAGGLYPVGNDHDGTILLTESGSPSGTVPYQGAIADFLSQHSLGGTNYVPWISKCIDLAAEEPNSPFLHVVLTDGVPGDVSAAERLLESTRTTNSHFVIIQFGTDSSATQLLTRWDENLGKGKPGIDNVSVVAYADPHSVTDEQFFDDVLFEAVSKWLPAARTNGYCK